MAADMAVELKKQNVACVSLWPGAVMTEHVNDFLSQPQDEIVIFLYLYFLHPSPKRSVLSGLRHDTLSSVFNCAKTKTSILFTRLYEIFS